MVAISEHIDTLKSITQSLYEQEFERDKERRRLKAFNSIIVKANESANQQELVQRILDACLDFVSFDIGGIYLLKDHVAKVVATKFIPDSATHLLQNLCRDRPELMDLFKFGKPIYIRHYHIKHEKNAQLLGGIKTLISIPILFNEQIKGCVNIGAFNDVDVSSEDCEILRTLGKHLGHVLYRLETEQELEMRIIEVEAYNQELQASSDEMRVIMDKLVVSQQQLEVERQNFYNLYNKMSDMIFVVSLEGIILAINDAVRRRLGYPNGQLINQPITILYDKNKCPTASQIIDEMINDEQKLCTMELISKTSEFIKVDTRVVHGLWNGIEVLYSVSREV